MPPHFLLRASACISALSAPMAHAQITPADDANLTRDDILVIAQVQQQTIENAPSSSATITADQIATTINAVNVEDSLKYLPSLVIRKRHIGDTQAPIATRTSGLGASARSLIFADGVLLSALIANNNSGGSPRWGLVGPDEVSRIDVLYGPFSAAYSGNSIGTVVNITTRLPDGLEIRASALANVQSFEQYGTKDILPTYQLAASIGDRFGPLSLFASVSRTDSQGQPISYITAVRPAAPSAAGTIASGGSDDRNRLGASIRVLGAGGIENNVQSIYKIKAALDLSDTLRATYVGGMFVDDTAARAESYLSTPANGTVYSGALNLGGFGYTVAGTAFSSSLYRRDARHISHALTVAGGSDALNWQVVGTIYDYDHDIQRTPTAALPAALSGGAGQIVRLDGTGWRTVDAKAAWQSGRNILSFGAHFDRYQVNSNRFSTTDWLSGAQGNVALTSRGTTRAFALWGQDAFDVTPDITLTLGARYEWWRAYNGRNFSLSPALNVDQPERSAGGFSPKASVEWRPAEQWSIRASFGKALRFPTVGELYQAITTGATLTVPNPDLRPERGLSGELAIERQVAKGKIRLSLFTESIEDALISQSSPLVAGSTTLFNFVQNVERTRVRGIEAAFDRQDFVPRFDISGSVTYTDSQTRKNDAFPDSIGKLLPSVPRWKATGLITWRASDQLSLTTAARFASRNFATLDNSDIVGNTFQGFYKYFVIDARMAFKVNDHATVALGVDNLNNAKYFLFHPFPQRSFTAQFNWKL